MTHIRYADRREAGRLLAARLLAIGDRPDVVLGLAPGGVPVALEIAIALAAPLDVFVVRPLPLPGDATATMGVIAAGGVRVLDRSTIAEHDVAPGVIDDVARREAIELARLEQAYRAGRRARKMTGRAILVADDGLTPRARWEGTVDALAAYRPARVIVALPVASREVQDAVRRKVSRVACLELLDDAEVTNVYPGDLEPISARDVRASLAEAEEHRQKPRDRAALG
jgi:predicted phosphoribosyltransferase